MSACVIFGGAGYIGTNLARRLLARKRFDRVHLADIRPSDLEGQPGITYSRTDVRQPIPIDLILDQPAWIFNLAAIHREPGHDRAEYFETNLNGARNVCDYAERTGCANIYFTSSISVYGPTNGPTPESAPIRPSTPYGGSKYPAELIHEAWQRSGINRRLIVSRPGVVYGPGDPGNILRMINAIRRGYFAFPGNPNIYKSYAYIEGLLDSIEFFMDRDDPQAIYNYVETPTQPLIEVVDEIKSFLECKAAVLPLPLWTLLPAANLVQAIFGSRNPVHPVRVRKAATPTHIVPQKLKDLGFEFRYSFRRSLEHWASVAPADFGLSPAAAEAMRRLELRRSGEEVAAGDRVSDRSGTPVETVG